MNETTFEIAVTDPRSTEAVALIQSLSEELVRRYDHDDGSGNFKPEDVLVTRSAFVIGRAVACGAFRPLGDGVAEIKRMFVAPDFRGRGYSRAILSELERLARQYGYSVVRLETGNRQPEAIQLYEGSGYKRIPNFGIYVDNEMSLCFEKRLLPADDWVSVVRHHRSIEYAVVDRTFF